MVYICIKFETAADDFLYWIELKFQIFFSDLELFKMMPTTNKITIII